MGKIRIEVWEEIPLNMHWYEMNIRSNQKVMVRNSGGKTYLVSYVNDELETALDKISFYEAIPIERLKQDIEGVGR